MNDLTDSPPENARVETSDPSVRREGSNAPEMSVSELSDRLKKTVEDAYAFVRVRGELGRVTLAKSGHLYVDLKDDKSVLNTIMWKGAAQKLQFRPEEGLEVIAEGRLSTYPGRSNYQLIADRMAPAGAGALMQLLEERKRKLAAEGLFAAERKKPLPALPQVIGVVTSPTGAVIRDILHRLADRFPVHVLIWPALVQGELAAEQVAQGVRGFNALPADSAVGGGVPRPDLIIVARGGGSIEDLWPFNDERVVRAVAESDIPVISAVGHETDTTLIDYASDRRAPTPTGAAEMAVPVRSELMERLEMLGARARRALKRGLEHGGAELRAAAARLPRPESLVILRRQRLDFASEKLGLGLKSAVGRNRRRLDRAEARLQPIALQREIVRRRTHVETLFMRTQFATRRIASEQRGRLRQVTRRYAVRDPRRAIEKQKSATAAVFEQVSSAMARLVEKRRAALDAQARLLSSVSHANVLARGFVIVQRMNGELVRFAADVDSGERLKLQFADDEQRVTADIRSPEERPRIVGVGGPKPPPQSQGGQGSLF